MSAMDGLGRVLPGADGYRRRLAAACSAVEDRDIPLVARHNDLTMWNVLLDAKGSIGVIDWGEAEETGLPLTDFLYAAVDATAASRGYRSRLEAVQACFPEGGAGSAGPLRDRIAEAIGIGPDAVRLCFHACWLRHARNETTAGPATGPFSRSPDGWPARMSERRRILFLAPFPPDPDGSHGGARAIGQMIDQLAGRHDAAVLHMRAPGEVPMPGYLEERLALADEVARPDRQSTHARRAVALGRALARGRGNAGMGERLARAGIRQAARRDHGRLAPGCRPGRVPRDGPISARGRPGARARRARGRGRGAAAELAAGSPESGLARSVDAAAWRRYERRAIAAADATVALTERIGAACGAGARCADRAHSPGRRTPSALDPAGTDPPRICSSATSRILQTSRRPGTSRGHLSERPFPCHPRRPLELVGDRPPRALRSSPGVVVAGAVSDSAYLDRAAVVVVPARLGGGMRVKVLETSPPARRSSGPAGRSRESTSSPATQAIVVTPMRARGPHRRALDDPERRGRVAAAGRALVAAASELGACGSRLHGSLYESLLGRDALTVEQGESRRTLDDSCVSRPARRRRRVSYGSLRRLTPISDRWGLDRGTPIDRHYIEQFLGRHAGGRPRPRARDRRRRPTRGSSAARVSGATCSTSMPATRAPRSSATFRAPARPSEKRSTARS